MNHPIEATDAAWAGLLASTLPGQIRTQGELAVRVRALAAEKRTTVDMMWEHLPGLLEETEADHVAAAYSVLPLATQYREAHGLPEVEAPPVDQLLGSIADVLEHENVGHTPGTLLGDVAREAYHLRRMQEDRDILREALALGP